MKQRIFSAEAGDARPLTCLEKTADAPRMYRLDDVDCTDGICGIRICYDRADGCTQVRVCDSDGTVYGIVMATSYVGEQVTYADIAPITGTKTLYLIPEGRLNILRVELLDHSPYDDIAYEPVPDECVIDN